MKTISILTILLCSTWAAASSAARADAITNAKAAELSLHRVERLVTLKKVDESYQSKFSGLAVTPVTHTSDTDPAYESLLKQSPGADGTLKSLKIVMDTTGKEIQHVVIAGADPTSPASWPIVDPVTLSENALHYILDNYTTVSQLEVFYVGLTTLTLSPVTDASGAAAAALVEIHAGTADPILRITMKLDGTFESYQIASSRE